MTPEELAALVNGMTPVIRDYVARMVGPLAHRMTVAETQLAAVVTQTTAVGPLRERVAVLETLAPVPGPPGPAGRDGKNGVDGLGYDELALETIDDTTVVVKATRGERVKTIGSVTFPAATFVGDYDASRAYTPGNIVRWKSALWHCRVATSIAPDAISYDGRGKAAGPQGKDAWLLLLRDGKRGSDGKDGGPGPQGPPGADWQQVYDTTRRR